MKKEMPIELEEIIMHPTVIGSRGQYLYSKEQLIIAFESGNNLGQRSKWVDDFYELLSKKVLVEVFPIDGWDEWVYRITIEDSMAPMFIAFENNPSETFTTHKLAMIAGIAKAKEMI